MKFHLIVILIPSPFSRHLQLAPIYSLSFDLGIIFVPCLFSWCHRYSFFVSISSSLAITNPVFLALYRFGTRSSLLTTSHRVLVFLYSRQNVHRLQLSMYVHFSRLFAAFIFYCLRFLYLSLFFPVLSSLSPGIHLFAFVISSLPRYCSFFSDLPSLLDSRHRPGLLSVCCYLFVIVILFVFISCYFSCLPFCFSEFWWGPLAGVQSSMIFRTHLVVIAPSRCVLIIYESCLSKLRSLFLTLSLWRPFVALIIVIVSKFPDQNIVLTEMNFLFQLLFMFMIICPTRDLWK